MEERKGKDRIRIQCQPTEEFWAWQKDELTSRAWRMQERKASQRRSKVASTPSTDKPLMTQDSAARRTRTKIQGSLRSKMRKMMKKDDQAAWVLETTKTRMRKYTKMRNWKNIKGLVGDICQRLWQLIQSWASSGWSHIHRQLERGRQQQPTIFQNQMKITRGWINIRRHRWLQTKGACHLAQTRPRQTSLQEIQSMLLKVVSKSQEACSLDSQTERCQIMNLNWKRNLVQSTATLKVPSDSENRVPTSSSLQVHQWISVKARWRKQYIQIGVTTTRSSQKLLIRWRAHIFSRWPATRRSHRAWCKAGESTLWWTRLIASRSTTSLLWETSSIPLPSRIWKYGTSTPCRPSAISKLIKVSSNAWRQCTQTRMEKLSAIEYSSQLEISLTRRYRSGIWPPLPIWPPWKATKEK